MSGISVWRGIGSRTPFAGFHQSECCEPSRRSSQPIPRDAASGRRTSTYGHHGPLGAGREAGEGFFAQVFKDKVVAEDRLSSA